MKQNEDVWIAAELITDLWRVCQDLIECLEAMNRAVENGDITVTHEEKTILEVMLSKTVCDLEPLAAKYVGVLLTSKDAPES